MKSNGFLALTCLVGVAAAYGRDFRVTDYGAKADGSKCTAAFAAAVRDCAGSGGGRVVVPAGTYYTGAVHLRSDVELHLEKDAEILFSDDREDYLPAVLTSWEGLECMNLSPLLYACGCTNVAVTGSGTIRAKMDYWYEQMKEGKTDIQAARAILYRWGSEDYPVGKRDMPAAHPAVLRPQLIQFNRCRDVRMEGVHVKDSPFWTIHFFMCDGVVVRGIDVCAHGFNNDGVDLEMTRNVLVEDSVFDQGDDGFVFKAGRNRDAWRTSMPTENVEIRNCHVKQAGSLVGVGSELSGGIRNIYVHDCTVDNASRLYFIKTNHRRGGFVKNVRLENVRTKVVLHVAALSTSTLYQWAAFPDYETRITEIDGLSLKNVSCEACADCAISLHGDRRLPARNVRFENVSVGRIKSKLVDIENVEGVELVNVRGGEVGDVSYEFKGGRPKDGRPSEKKAVPADGRPYEFRDAKRDRDEVEPWIDFDTEAGWTARTVGPGEARAFVSTNQYVFGRASLEVRARGAKTVLVRPAGAMALPKKGPQWFGVWIWSDGKANYTGPLADHLAVPSLDFTLADGSVTNLPCTDVTTWSRNAGISWPKGWFYKTRHFTEAERKLLARDGVKFAGLRLDFATVSDLPREFHFDNLAFFDLDESNPLDVVPYAEGLPIPTRKEGARPKSSAAGARNHSVLSKDGRTRIFFYEGKDGVLAYHWKGDLGTLTASWNHGPQFRPMAGGGAKDFPAKAVYEPEIDGKTLIVKVRAPAGERWISPGAVADAKTLSVNHIPVYRRDVPAVDDGRSKLFVHAFADWYFSGASRMDDRKGGDCLYQPKTDGAFNPVEETVYVTVSPDLMETLPVVANPPSPWKHVTGSHAWCSYGSSRYRDFDKKFWRRLHRAGVRSVAIGDHECCMRDEGDSFTFRDKPAPLKGGEAGLKDYASFLIDTLGFRYGPYNNFTDFAPVNANWSFDRATRESNGELRNEWVRCVSPKPSYGREACHVFPPRLKEKFGFNMAYCDVHSANAPWAVVDFDWRVPEAGRFSATYRAYAEILLSQKETWNGPVYSEGGYQFYYAGLTDGNYAQLGFKPAEEPWIVDLELKRVHPLQCDFGCGRPSMFEPGGDLDRFFGATLAFGHAPFLLINRMFKNDAYQGLGYAELAEGEDPEVTRYRPEGLRELLRGYFMIQPASRRYALAEAEEIRYLCADGEWRDVSGAIFAGERHLERIAVAWSDGTRVVVNAATNGCMKSAVFGQRVELPPCGYRVWNGDVLEIESSWRFGARADYSACEDSIYFDTRDADGELVFPRAKGLGYALCRRERDGWEIIPYYGTAAFRIEGVSARALDEEGRDLGPAGIVKDSDGYLSVKPVPGAYSYLVKP